MRSTAPTPMRLFIDTSIATTTLHPAIIKQEETVVAVIIWRYYKKAPQKYTSLSPKIYAAIYSPNQ